MRSYFKLAVVTVPCAVIGSFLGCLVFGITYGWLGGVVAAGAGTRMLAAWIMD